MALGLPSLPLGLHKSAGTVAPFDPVSRIVGWTSGFWLDMSDRASGFTDTAGTVVHTASGDPTGRRNDKSGLAHHFLRIGADTNRPLWTDGAVDRDAYDGLDDETAAAQTYASAMDLYLLVYREDTSETVLFYVDGSTTEFVAATTVSASACNNNAGTGWSMFVDGVAVGGVNSCTRTQLNNAVTPGAWHLVEARNLDLSGAAWVNGAFGRYGTLPLWGGIAGALCCPAQAADVRAYLRTGMGAKAGLSL